MSCSLDSLKRDVYGIILGTTVGVGKGDSRSLDYSSYLHSSRAIYLEIQVFSRVALSCPKAY